MYSRLPVATAALGIRLANSYNCCRSSSNSHRCNYTLLCLDTDYTNTNKEAASVYNNIPAGYNLEEPS